MTRTDPAEPLELLAALARRLRLEGWQARVPVPEVDGSLLLRFRAGERVATARWVLPHAADAAPSSALVRLEGLAGALLLDGLTEAEGATVARALREAVHRLGSPALGLGPAGDDPIEFVPEALGAQLAPWLATGTTRWATLQLVELTQPSRERLVLCFDAPEGGVTVALTATRWQPLADGRAGFSRRDLRLSLEADARPPDVRSRLDGQVERWCGFAVARLLANDPRLRLAAPVAATQAPATADDAAGFRTRFADRMRQEAWARRWKADYRWRRFLYPQDRCIVNLFRLGADETLVAHESLECVFNEPPWLPPDAALFAGRRDATVGEYWHGDGTRVTDLRGRDLARGGSMAKLDRALEEASRGPRGRSVVVYSGCLPLLIGDNPVPTMRRLHADGPTRFYWLSATNDFGGYTAELVRERLDELAPASAPRDPLGVALVGGRTPREDAELLALVDALGLHGLGLVLPDVSYEAFARVREASLFAWSNQTSLRDVAELMFTGLPVVLLRARSPVGLEGTLQWLERIVGSLGPDNPGVDVVAGWRAAPPWAERLAHLRERTAGHALAFAADADELRLLQDTTPLYAYPLLDVVLEMGFDVHLLVTGPADLAGARAALASRGLDGRVTFGDFADATQLVDRLREPRIGAVFSDFTADPRAVAAGRASFSEADLELGVEGFFRAAERLLRRCRLRPFAALDAPPREVA